MTPDLCRCASCDQQFTLVAKARPTSVRTPDLP